MFCLPSPPKKMFIYGSVRAVTRLSERLWKTVGVEKQHAPTPYL